jgi:flagellar basal-body rod protein FlgC
MGLFDSLNISASALTAERVRMDVTAENLANAQTTRGADGGPYRRKDVVLEQADGAGGFGATLRSAMGVGGGSAGGVRVAQIAEDQQAPRRVHDPTHPDADGYVELPNVDTVAEMVVLITSQRAYEANVTAMQSAKAMFAKTLEILR